MLGQKRRARVLFILSDIVSALAAFAVAYRIRVPLHWHFVFFLTAEQTALILGFSLFAWIGIGLWLKLYDRLDARYPRTILRDSVRQCAAGGICLLVFEYALRMDLSRFFLALYVTLACAFNLVLRFGALYVAGVIRREFGSPHFVMVVGTGERAARIARSLERSLYPVRLHGFFQESDVTAVPNNLNSQYPVYPLSRLPDIVGQVVLDEILFAVDTQSLTDLEDVFLLCDQEGIRTRIAVDFFPHVNSTVSLEHLDATPLLTFSAAPHDEVRLLIKRLADITIAAAGLVTLTPVMAVIAILIRFTTPGPAIFRQVRCGLNGRRFLLYKFRSMCANADAMKASVAHLNTRGTAFKIPNDPRVTAVGRYLRKFSIDEWPQLWNVLRGDMSLVGPRPAIPTEVERYERWQRRRLRMRPGLTCLWALNGRDQVDFETWMRMDMQYIDDWSLALDWKILLRTIPRIMTGRGAS